MDCSHSTLAGSPVILIGMHRSGTSLVSQLLQKMGVHMGADTTKTHESIFFREINRRLMRRFSARWYRPEPMWNVVSDQARIEDSVGQFESACQSRASQAYTGGGVLQDSCWGWKDPRSTITLPIWMQLFPKAKVIHIIRNGIDVADSLLRRSQLKQQQAWRKNLRATAKSIVRGSRPQSGTLPFSVCRFQDLEDAFDLWRCYLKFGEFNIQHLPQDRLHVLRFEDLAAQPVLELQRLVQFTGCSPQTSAVEDMAAEINHSRAWSFEDNDTLKEFADRMSTDPVMMRYGYGADRRFCTEPIDLSAESRQAASRDVEAAC